jgi:nucleotide-binding universal stress UspA family protein
MNSSQNKFLAAEDFRRARRDAALEDIMARFTGRSADLIPFEDVKQKLRVTSTSQRGLQEIPLDGIVGSVGRYTDFTRSFLPRKSTDEERWARVQVYMNESGFDPIDVYKVGDAYFVLDGNHRVSIARRQGMKTIPAYVTEVKTKVPLSPSAQPDDLIRMEEQARFLETTGLDQTRPDGTFEITLPGRYRLLEEQIENHRRALEERRGYPVPLPEAAADWYDNVYLPVARVIHDRGILRDFPGRTEADLYVWINQHREQLEQALGWAVASADAAVDLAEQVSPQPERVVARLGERLREALTPPELESGPVTGTWRRQRVDTREGDQLFADILVAVSGEEVGWQALEQAIVVAQREGGRLLGLHVVPSPARTEGWGVEAMQARFRQRCEEAGVPGHLVVEVGSVGTIVLDRARWTDLVTVTLSHPPGNQPLSRLRSGFRVLVQRCPRPLLVVPGETRPLKSALLAYDGSSKAEEALFVAAHMAARWNTSLVVITVIGDGRVTNALARAQEYLAHVGLEATLEQRTGSVPDNILQCARHYDSDLIIMGGYGMDSVREVVLGSAVDEVLRNVRRPMLICR